MAGCSAALAWQRRGAPHAGGADRGRPAPAGAWRTGWAHWLGAPAGRIQAGIIEDIGRLVRRLACRLADSGLNGQRVAVILAAQDGGVAGELADRYLVMARGEVIARSRSAAMEADQARQRVTIRASRGRPKPAACHAGQN